MELLPDAELSRSMLRLPTLCKDNLSYTLSKDNSRCMYAATAGCRVVQVLLSPGQCAPQGTIPQKKTKKKELSKSCYPPANALLKVPFLKGKTTKKLKK